MFSNFSHTSCNTYAQGFSSLIISCNSFGSRMQRMKRVLMDEALLSWTRALHKSIKHNKSDRVSSWFQLATVDAEGFPCECVV